MSKADEKYEKYAEDALAVLVERVLSSESAKDARIFYGKLSDAINGPGARWMRRVLGVMGRKIESVEMRGNSVPKIQSLVINLSEKIPGGGYEEFHKGYAELPRAEKQRIAAEEQNRVYVLGEKLLDVLAQLNIPHELSSAVHPDEIEDDSKIPEGAKKRVVVNRYERSLVARKKCIDKHGCKCSVCGFDFGRVYGKHGSGFIHVHHLKELSKIDKEYKVNPERDMRPVCPNCHAMIHRTQGRTLTIEELKKIIADNEQ